MISPDPKLLTAFWVEIIPPLTVTVPVNPLLSPARKTSPAPDFTKLPEPAKTPRNCGFPEVALSVRVVPLPIVTAPEPVKAEVVALELSTRFAPAATDRDPELIDAPVAKVSVPAETVVVPV
jgi:hypothetical protein